MLSLFSLLRATYVVYRALFFGYRVYVRTRVSVCACMYVCIRVHVRPLSRAFTFKSSGANALRAQSGLIARIKSVVKIRMEYD